MANGSVVAFTGGVAHEGKRSVGSVAAGGGVVRERLITGSRIIHTGSVAEECVTAVRRVEAAGGVVIESDKTSGRVVAACGVLEKHCCTDARISISGVGKECPGTDTGVVATGGNALERIPTNCCIVYAGGKAKKGALPLCRVPRPIGGRA